MSNEEKVVDVSSHTYYINDITRAFESRFQDRISLESASHLDIHKTENIFSSSDLSSLYTKILSRFLNFDPSLDSTLPMLSSRIEINRNTDVQLTVSLENVINQKRMDELKKEFTPELLHLIDDTDFEYGIDTRVDLFLRSRMKENSVCTKSWLNETFLENYRKPVIICGILRAISRFDYSDVFPEGQTMALAALSHSNSEVQECGIRSFEHWRNLSSLQILEKTKGNTLWLQEYINQVIQDLREELDVAVSKKNR